MCRSGSACRSRKLSLGLDDPNGNRDVGVIPDGDRGGPGYRRHPRAGIPGRTRRRRLHPVGGPSREELWELLPEELRAAGERLDVEGVAEDAFAVGVGGEVLNLLAARGATVLGGDFWKREPHRFRPANANWHYDDGVASESIDAARRALRQPWVAQDWYVVFVWA